MSSACWTRPPKRLSTKREDLVGEGLDNIMCGYEERFRRFGVSSLVVGDLYPLGNFKYCICMMRNFGAIAVREHKTSDRETSNKAYCVVIRINCLCPCISQVEDRSKTLADALSHCLERKRDVELLRRKDGPLQVALYTLSARLVSLTPNSGDCNYYSFLWHLPSTHHKKRPCMQG